MLKTIACVVGARPNFVKMAPILRELSAHQDVFKPVLIHTGQHYDPALSAVFFEQLGIPEPDLHLAVSSGAPAKQTAAIIEGFDSACAGQAFDAVLLVGDVTSTMACAIVAAKRSIQVIHVEAGLRSFDRTMPEEINRMVTDSITDLFYVSEPAGKINLVSEGHAEATIVFAGNVMIDSLVRHAPSAVRLAQWEKHGLRRQEYGVLTLHRPSNVDSVERLSELVETLLEVGARIPLLFPVHPRTRKNLSHLELAGGLIRLCEPLGYLEFLSLMQGSRLIITDSGGIQEESTALGIPCLTLRSNTERPITVEVGTNTLVGPEARRLLPLVEAVLSGTYKKGQIPERWDGHAAVRIADDLARRL